MIALVAVFVLLVQALVPAIASASPPGEQVICTGHGLQTIHVGDAAPTQRLAAGPCDHCLCAPFAAAPPVTAFAVLRLKYAAADRLDAVASRPPPPARAPPRPPGQGPPSSDA